MPVNAAECLATGEVSITVEDRAAGEDVEIEVIPNGQEVRRAIERVLARAICRKMDVAS